MEKGMTKNRRTLSSDEAKVEVLRLRSEGLSVLKIQEHTGIPKSTIHDFLTGGTYSKWWEDMGGKPIASGDLDDHRKDEIDLSKDHDVFIVTSAQNNTYVHRHFIQSIKTLEKTYEDAGFKPKIVVGTFTYNQSGFQNLQKTVNYGDAIWYDPMIAEYILNEPAKLAEGLLWCGELNILPTAVNPLSGLHSYTMNQSGIIPHAKMQLESVPTHKNDPCRMLYTTGTVTKRNYVQKKAGQKASFHHVFGALIVEVDSDGDWFVRQVVAEKDTGCFYDLDRYYTPYGVESGKRVEAINYGDLHSEKKDETVYDLSFGDHDESLLNQLKPKYQFVNDGLDFEARNHHNINDPYFRFKMYMNGRDKVEDNIADIASTMYRMQRDYTITVVVESNHDLAFQKWLKFSDYKTDPANAVYFLKNQLAQYKAIERGDKNFSVFENAVHEAQPNLKDILFLGTDESFRICDDDGNGIECGQHGHLGANGSRGSIGIYQKMGTRYNIGHSHSAGIKDGVYQAGVSGKLDMGYNQGATSWSHSHIITYGNGKRCIVTIKNGKHSLLNNQWHKGKQAV
jgi:hypothetical protein